MNLHALLALIGPLSFWELAIIMAVILIVFGPRNLPRLARSLGQAMREFRDAASRVTQDVGRELDEEDRARARQRRAESGRTPNQPSEGEEAPPTDDPKDPRQDKADGV